MPELSFRVADARVADDSAAPSIAVDLVIENLSKEQNIQSILLRSQIQIEAPRHRYSKDEQAKLKGLFGERSEWGRTLKPLLWTNATNVVGSFRDSTEVEVMLPCTIDVHAAVSTYFQGIDGGTIPLSFLFSGTTFYQTASHALQAAPISWNCEARYSFPVALWMACVEAHYTNTVWLPIRRDLYERLREMKAQRGLASLEDALERVVEGAREVAV